GRIDHGSPADVVRHRPKRDDSEGKCFFKPPAKFILTDVLQRRVVDFGDAPTLGLLDAPLEEINVEIKRRIGRDYVACPSVRGSPAGRDRTTALIPDDLR